MNLYHIIEDSLLLSFELKNHKCLLINLAPYVIHPWFCSLKIYSLLYLNDLMPFDKTNRPFLLWKQRYCYHSVI